MSLPPLVGMVHLPPLPGSPGFGGSMDAVTEDAAGKARILAQAGFQALMVENFGDAPFFADSVPAVTVAALTACVLAVRAASGVPVGVNVLRNDATGAMSIAAVTGAEMIRVNVLSGSMYTDQGLITGRAAEVARLRQTLQVETQVWADLFVKHATPPPGLTIEQAALDTRERAGADALIVSGPATGRAPDLERLEQVRTVVPDAPLVVGSGANAENLGDLAAVADSIIVGTYLEAGGRPGADLDLQRVEAFVTAAERAGLL